MARMYRGPLKWASAAALASCGTLFTIPASAHSHALLAPMRLQAAPVTHAARALTYAAPREGSIVDRPGVIGRGALVRVRLCALDGQRLQLSRRHVGRDPDRHQVSLG
jgi:hypothetical protein